MPKIGKGLMRDPAGENTDSIAADGSSVRGRAAQQRRMTPREFVAAYLGGLPFRTWSPTAALWAAPPSAAESRHVADNGVAARHRD
ncbi:MULTISPECIES: hypothetical protein [Amycolatopsis]|uniref:Uncharacterized protein n=1 Tax=Amycolatopsis albidoflavus TaxID=102226 RepID=A0ABW5I7Y1_9PSEU